MSHSPFTQKLGAGGTIIQAPTSSPFAGKFGPGEVVAGMYRIERRIGEGGMGIVLAARHLPSNQVMALKLLHQEGASADGAVARFWREARAVSRLQHPNVVRIFDVGTLADDTPYMAMELLDGETLGARIDRRGALPVEEALGYLQQACAAVEAAHALGVVHRDLKPDNMFLTRGPHGEVLKVLDFGISKAMAATASDDKQNLTKTTDVFGSPTYMSPEQLKASRDVDGRADVWSLGVILHEMIAGAVPFDGRTVAEIFGAILYMPPKPLTQIRKDVPPAIESAVLRALEKDREKRLPDVASFRAALQGNAPAPPVVNEEAIAPRTSSRLWIVAVLVVLAVAAATFLIVGRFR